MQVQISQFHIAYGADLFLDMGASFLTGMRWDVVHDDSLVALDNVSKSHPIASILFLLAISYFALLGIYSLFQKKGLFRILALVAILPIPLFLLFAVVAKSALYHWYTVNMLPVFWIMVAIGIGFAAKFFGGESSKRVVVSGAVLIVLTCIAFLWIGNGQRQMQVDIPLDPSLESVRVTRKIIDPFDPRTKEVLTVGFHKDTRGNDPALYRVQNGSEMFDMMVKADKENKPLYVNLAHIGFARGHRADIMEVIDDERYFEEIAMLKAMEPTATRWVFRYKPGSYQPTSED